MLPNEGVPTNKTAQWLHFVANTEDCMTSIKSINVALMLVTNRPEIEEPDLPNIAWLVYMQQVLIDAMDEKLQQVQYRITDGQEE